MRKVIALCSLLTACAHHPDAPPPTTPAPAPSPAPAPLPAPAAAPVTTTPREGHRLYTKDDLAALERDQAWSELVDHLEDVPPSERDEHWKTLVTRSVVASLGAARKNGTDKLQLAQVTEAVARRYPSLREAAAYKDIRGDIAVDAVPMCSEYALDRWEQRCEPLVRMFEGDAKRATTAAQSARDHGDRRTSMALYRLASDLDGAALCQNDRALTVMIESLSSPDDSAIHKDAIAMQTRCRALKKKP